MKLLEVTPARCLMRHSKTIINEGGGLMEGDVFGSEVSCLMETIELASLGSQLAQAGWQLNPNHHGFNASSHHK